MTINKKDILQQTSNGLDIFSHYFGKNEIKKRLFKNPYRGDSISSCNLQERKNRSGETYWYFKDFGDTFWRGDCFEIVAKIKKINLSTDFYKLLKIIKSEMSLYAVDSVGDTESITSKREESILSFSYTEIEPSVYWNQYGITKETLKKYNVKTLSELILKDTKNTYAYFGSSSEPIFSYNFSSGGIKVYRPYSKPKFIYAGELPSPYMFGYHELPDTGKEVIITGGEKDVLSLVSHGFNAICMNSETSHIRESLIKELSQRFGNIILMYDCDATGSREMSRIERLYRKKYNIRSVTLPLSGTKQSKDVSDWFKENHTSQELSFLIL